MFRRKEEEYAAGAGSAPTTASTNTGSTNDSATLVYTPAPSAPQNANTAASYAPQPAPAQTATRPVVEPARPQTQAAPTASSFRPAAPSAARSESKPQVSTPQSSPEKSAKGNRRILTVGNEIMLTGEISSCDLVVVEGNVDAKLSKVHTLEIASNGSFKGSAQIENAEISGLFEGELVVKNRLVIYTSGKVRGKITYGEIEIERGGELTGEVKTGAASGEIAKPTSTKAA